MRVLSLHQPYASLVALNIKTIETRGRAAPKALIGQRIAIHAAKRWPVKGEYPGECAVDLTGDLMYWLPEPFTEEQAVAAGLPPDGDLIGFPLPLGYILATALLADCVPIRGSTGWALSMLPPTVLMSDDAPLVMAPDGRSIEDQRPYGDFRHGRWAYLFEDVEPLAVPEPFRGGQGWSKSWSPT